MIQWNSKNKSSSKNLLPLLQGGDVDFCVKVGDDIHVHAALEVQSKEPRKKVMMIFQEPILDAPMEASIQESDSRIGNPSVSDPRIQDASANNFSGSRIK